MRVNLAPWPPRAGEPGSYFPFWIVSPGHNRRLARRPRARPCWRHVRRHRCPSRRHSSRVRAGRGTLRHDRTTPPLPRYHRQHPRPRMRPHHRRMDTPPRAAGAGHEAAAGAGLTAPLSNLDGPTSFRVRLATQTRRARSALSSRAPCLPSCRATPLPNPPESASQAIATGVQPRQLAPPNRLHPPVFAS